MRSSSQVPHTLTKRKVESGLTDKTQRDHDDSEYQRNNHLYEKRFTEDLSRSGDLQPVADPRD